MEVAYECSGTPASAKPRRPATANWNFIALPHIENASRPIREKPFRLSMRLATTMPSLGIQKYQMLKYYYNGMP
jgi:hypothetical protein